MSARYNTRTPPLLLALPAMSLTSLDASPFPSIPPPALNFNNTIGALIVGTILSSFLAGMTFLQVYIYRQTSQSDSKLLRGVIYFLWALDLVHTALFAHGAYYYASRLSNPLALLHPRWDFSINMALGSANNFVITFIYVGRIWCLYNRNRFAVCFSGLSIALSVIAMGASLGVMSTSFKVATYLEWSEKYRWLWYLTFGTRSTADLTIALTMIILLSKSRTRFSSTNKVIRFIILYCVNTGILTVTASVLSIITFAILPTSFIPYSATTLIPKFMLTSMLSFLNSRRIVREKHFKAGVLSIPLTTLRFYPNTPTVPREENDCPPQTLTSVELRSTVSIDEMEKGTRLVATI